MIKSLKIKNILSHVDSELEFSPGVNMIIGPSGHGKSAILHSLNWGMYNRPGGENHRNWDGGDMLSKIELDEGGSITLSKDKQSQYTVELPGKKPKIFKAFGANPPEEIPALLNLHKKINIQTQFEPIFLLSESPGEVAKFFNDVAGLELINQTESKGKLDLKKTKDQHESIKTQVKDKKEELSQYNGIEELEEKVIGAVRLNDKIKLEESLIENLKYAFTDIQEINNILEELKKRNQIKGKIKKAQKLWDKIEIDASEIYSFEEKRDQIIDLQNQTEYLESKTGILPKIDRAINIIQIGKNRKNEINILNGYKSDIDSLHDFNQKLIKQNKDTQIQFNGLMSAICPLCGRSDNEKKN